MVRTTIMLPPALKGRAERRARANGVSLGELIREALEAVLETSQADDPLFSDDDPYRGEAPDDLSVHHDEYLYGSKS